MVARCSNGSTLVGYVTGESHGAHVNIEDVRWKHEGSNVFSIWVKVQHYAQISPFVDFFGGALGGWNPENTSTGSTSAPSGSTAFSEYAYKQIAGVNTIQYTASDTYFLENVRMTNGKGIDFSATGNGTGGSSINETLDDYEFGDFTPTMYSNTNINSTSGENSSHTGAGQYVKVGKLVTVTVDFNNLHGNAPDHVLRYITGLPFTSRSNNRTTAAIGYQRGLRFAYASSIETTNMHHLYGHIGGSETRITLNASKGSSPYSGWPATHNTSSTSQYLRITISYFVD